MTIPSGCALQSAIEQMDLLAESALRLVEPLKIELAVSPRDRESAYRLRFRTVVDHGWGTPAQFPSGMEKDEHDDSALQIVAREGDVVVGTVRIIFPAADRSLPTEEAFGWKAPGGVVEVGRVCRDTRSTSGLGVFCGLISRAWIEMRKSNYSQCCGVAALDMIHVYEDLGFEVVRVAPARLYWGEQRWPVIIRPFELGQGLYQTV